MCVIVMEKGPLLIKFDANGDGSFQGEDLPSHKSDNQPNGGIESIGSYGQWKNLW